MSKMKKVELLAPCGSFEALKMAIASGADAVYLGGNQFGARAYAKNFSDDEIVEAIKFAHLYQVKVYVTLNTLIYDHEFQKVMDYVDFLYHHDVDALIIQDLGLMCVIRQYYDDLDLHASTQMTIHNIDGIKLLEEYGVKRVVLARENTIDEIEEMNRKTSIETEVFVHGALCVGYSGQCLMSSLIGGRSGNRGRCAQPCRKLYDIGIDDEIINKNKYFLSPRDLNTIEYLDDIISSGVSSLKIEGRMKSPEYVGTVVSIYRKVIDEYQVSKNDKDDLKQIFNRQFTKGFLFHDKGKDYINTENNKNMGVLCGIVKDSNHHKVTIKCLKPIRVQDGIYFEKTNQGLTISRIMKNGEVVEEAEIGEVITIDVKDKVLNGVKVFKTKDVQLEEKARKKTLDKIDIYMVAILKIGKKPKLIITDRLGNRIESTIDFMIEKSEKQPISENKIIKQLSKLGNTPFSLKSIDVKKDEDIFIVISMLNQLRRTAINTFKKKRETYYHRNKYVQYLFHKESKLTNYSKPTLSVYCHQVEQVQAALECNMDKIYVNEDIFDEFKQNKHLLYQVTKRIDIKPTINLNSKGIVISNLGHLYQLKGKSLEAISNVNLNVTNSESIQFLRDNGVSFMTLSYEMNESVLKDLLFEDKSKLEIIVYGYQEMMESKHHIFHEIPYHLDKEYYLIDKKNEKFIVNLDKSQHMHLYNSKKLILSSEIYQLMKYGYHNFRIQLLNENREETKQVIDSYLDLLYKEEEGPVQLIVNNHKKSHRFTRGYYNREIL